MPGNKLHELTNHINNWYPNENSDKSQMKLSDSINIPPQNYGVFNMQAAQAPVQYSAPVYYESKPEAEVKCFPNNIIRSEGKYVRFYINFMYKNLGL